MYCRITSLRAVLRYSGVDYSCKSLHLSQHQPSNFLISYLDTVRFIGAMIIVISRMMRESLIFFALLVLILLGFLQAFVGLDQVDNELTAVSFVTKAMLNAIMTSPEFDGFDNYAVFLLYRNEQCVLLTCSSLHLD